MALTRYRLGAPLHAGCRPITAVDLAGALILMQLTVNMMLSGLEGNPKHIRQLFREHHLAKGRKRGQEKKKMMSRFPTARMAEVAIKVAIITR
jgi:hypothetical protein